MEAVASRANVGKPTVYRWWPDRHAVVMAALLGEAQPAAMASAEQRSALDELKEQLLQVVTRFATPTGRHIASMLAAADPGSELARAFRGHFVLARRDEGRAILQRGIERGELREDIDVEAAVDQLLGAVFLRLLLGHAPLDATFVEQLVGNARLGLAARR
jgi:AcrR family transcriptional regulator